MYSKVLSRSVYKEKSGRREIQQRSYNYFSKLGYKGFFSSHLIFRSQCCVYAFIIVENTTKLFYRKHEVLTRAAVKLAANCYFSFTRQGGILNTPAIVILLGSQEEIIYKRCR